MRYQATLDRQLEKKIHELERLQEKRKEKSTSDDLPDPESDEDDADGASTREVVRPGGELVSL